MKVNANHRRTETDTSLTMAVHRSQCEIIWWLNPIIRISVGLIRAHTPGSSIWHRSGTATNTWVLFSTTNCVLSPMLMLPLPVKTPSKISGRCQDSFWPFLTDRRWGRLTLRWIVLITKYTIQQLQNALVDELWPGFMTSRGCHTRVSVSHMINVSSRHRCCVLLSAAVWPCVSWFGGLSWPEDQRAHGRRQEGQAGTHPFSRHEDVEPLTLVAVSCELLWCCCGLWTELATVG